MQNPTDCLTAAMFIASESYSGSAYAADLFDDTDELCDDTFAFAPASDATNQPAMAA